MSWRGKKYDWDDGGTYAHDDLDEDRPEPEDDDDTNVGVTTDDLLGDEKPL